jgi:putative Mg2+ transporter-C (MgtC) family protein
MWSSLHFLELIGTLLLAAVLGALIGFERERADHPAGLRTHILVCVGAALVTLVSASVAGTRWDPGRIAAQIVSGIGFLGAGTILRQGSIIRGLTTAASLWVVSGIGMAAAAGAEMALLAVVAALLVFFTLATVNRLEDTYVNRRGYHGVSITMEPDRDAIGELLLGIVEQGVELRRVAIGDTADGALYRVELLLRTPPGLTEPSLSVWLGRRRGVKSFEWE